MKATSLFLVIGMSCGLACPADEIRRIRLDGTGGLAAPAAEAGKDGIERIHKVPEPGLELFPSTVQPSRGTIQLHPGGGYAILAINHEGRDVAAALNRCGYDVAVLLYRVSEGPDTRALALADSRAAWTLLRTRGSEWGLNTRKMGVMGFSAGGHLAARLVHETQGAQPPDFAALIYPAYLEKDRQLLDEVKPGAAPAFVYVAANDTWAPSSRAYHEFALAQQRPCTYHEAPTGGHGFGVKKNLPEAVRDWTEKLCAFLDAQTK